MWYLTTILFTFTPIDSVRFPIVALCRLGMESMEPPILDAGGSSGSDDEDPVAADRAMIPVGRRRNLRFIGTCLGHDVSWRGSQVIRVVTLQAGGVGGADREAWGRWWAECAAELGADVFCVG